MYNVTTDMIRTIASESTSLAQYARRVEAFNCSLSQPYSVAELSRHYPLQAKPGMPCKKVERAIRKARVERLAKRHALWGALVESI